ncbi:MAG TPA: DUF3060 domain-containing protein [Pseudonocardiaceae bacterium]|nr:DUF3060 domain-containing protein [Pseudonocardiaceae bacterium]
MGCVVRGLMVTACAGVAAVAVAACGSSPASQPAPARPQTSAASSTAAAPPAASSVVPTSPDRHGGGQDGDVGDDRASAVHGAVAAPNTVTRSGATGLVYDCSSTSSLLLSGSHDSVTLVGTCEQLTVSGSGDTVTVANAVAIRVTGDDDHVTWGTGNPQVTNTGTGNVIRHGTVPTASSGGSGGGTLAPATVSASDAHTYACSNQAVTISAGNATVTLTGTCASVTVTGRDDTVHAAAVASITVSGSDNHITWQSGPSGDTPTIHNTGTDNTVTHG